MGFRALLMGRMNTTTQELIVPAKKKKMQGRSKITIQVIMRCYSINQNMVQVNIISLFSLLDFKLRTVDCGPTLPDHCSRLFIF